MKQFARTLAAGAALFLAAASPASAATTASGNSSVTADVVDTLEATFPAAYAWGGLNAGAAGNQSAEQTVNVMSNQTWGVEISSDLADGRMMEWDGLAYDATSPLTFTNPLEWRFSSLDGVAQGTSYAALSSTGALVTGSQPITPDGGTDVGTRYQQVVSYGDVSAGSNDYRLLVNYDVQQGW
jgi:hypothetical protein